MWLQQLRVYQWVKNLFVLLPIVFAYALSDTMALRAALLALVACCLASSSVYLFNDWRDRDDDMLRRRTRLRPYAAGRIATYALLTVMALLACAALVLGFAINAATGCALLGYLTLNVLYSLWLKRVVLVDVCCIALGFFLRAYIGSTATGIPISLWFSVTVFALALALALGKRLGDIRSHTDESTAAPSLPLAYSESFLRQANLGLTLLTVAFYSLWALEASSHQAIMIYTVPLVLVAMLFYLFALSRQSENGDPTDILYHSRGLQVVLLLYLVIVAVQYFL